MAALRAVLALDGLIELAFGAALSQFPVRILSTIFDLPAMGVDPQSSIPSESLGESLIVTLAHTYAVLGATLLTVGLGATDDAGARRVATRTAYICAMGHAVRGAKCISEARRPWIVGNPWYDVVVHSGFTATYLFAIWDGRHLQ